MPPALLVGALNSSDLRLHLPGSISTILGERGLWLAQQNPEWQSVLAKVHPSQDLTTWETDSLHDRSFFIQRLHENDPKQARELLTAALRYLPSGWPPK